MPSLNFKAQFAYMVASGAKCQTIRARRKRPIKEWDDLSFFTGMRTKQCRRLRANAVCVRALAIDIYPREVWIDNDKLLSAASVDELALRDGFTGRKEFVAWFKQTHGLPFKGQIVEWQP